MKNPEHPPVNRSALLRGALRGLVATICIGLPAAGAAENRSLARSGEWQLTLVDDPFHDPQRACVVQTTSEGPTGGRRTRPEIRLLPGTAKMVINPTVTLTHAIRLYRKVLDTRDAYDAERFMPSNELKHQLRVDGGEIHEVVIKDPEFGAWKVHESIDSVSGLMDAMQRGKTLYYRWEMDRAKETFEFALDGLASVLREGSASCP